MVVLQECDLSNRNYLQLSVAEELQVRYLYSAAPRARLLVLRDSEDLMVQLIRSAASDVLILVDQIVREQLKRYLPKLPETLHLISPDTQYSGYRTLLIVTGDADANLQLVLKRASARTAVKAGEDGRVIIETTLPRVVSNTQLECEDEPGVLEAEGWESGLPTLPPALPDVDEHYLILDAVGLGYREQIYEERATLEQYQKRLNDNERARVQEGLEDNCPLCDEPYPIRQYYSCCRYSVCPECYRRMRVSYTNHCPQCRDERCETVLVDTSSASIADPITLTGLYRAIQEIGARDVLLVCSDGNAVDRMTNTRLRHTNGMPLYAIRSITGGKVCCDRLPMTPTRATHVICLDSPREYAEYPISNAGEGRLQVYYLAGYYSSTGRAARDFGVDRMDALTVKENKYRLTLEENLARQIGHVSQVEREAVRAILFHYSCIRFQDGQPQFDLAAIRRQVEQAASRGVSATLEEGEASWRYRGETVTDRATNLRIGNVRVDLLELVTTLDPEVTGYGQF